MIVINPIGFATILGALIVLIVAVALLLVWGYRKGYQHCRDDLYGTAESAGRHSPGLDTVPATAFTNGDTPTTQFIPVSGAGIQWPTNDQIDAILDRGTR